MDWGEERVLGGVGKNFGICSLLSVRLVIVFIFGKAISVSFFLSIRVFV